MLHRRQERDKGGSVHERERLPGHKVSSFRRVPTRRDENPAPGLLGMHHTEQLSGFLDTDSLRLPMLALDQDLALAMEDQIDPAVGLAAAALFDRIPLPSIGLCHQGFEILPTQRSDRVNARLAINEASFAKLAEGGERRG